MSFVALCGLGAGRLAWAHGQPADSKESAQDYAARHMATEHHIENFDLKSFFKLHDLNRDGYWDPAEIEAVYGVHHEYSKKKTPTEEAQAAKAKQIVDAVLAKMDTNRDGRVDMKEFEAAGFQGLESFKELGADGHHYDIESEYYLHHEEQFHSTPETQADEAYNHPEDMEHFAMHEKIELDEENKERKFQGLPPVDKVTPPEEKAQGEVQLPPGAKPYIAPQGAGAKTQRSFTRPQQKGPEEKYQEAVKEAAAKPEWGQGDDGYKRPKSDSERLRRNLPYKYKFRRSWGDF